MIFAHGPNGCDIWEPDEHSDAGHVYADAMNLKHFAEHGRYATFDQQIEWCVEGEAASRRRLTMQEYEQVKAAEVLLQRHGYKLRPPRWADAERREPTPETPRFWICEKHGMAAMWMNDWVEGWECRECRAELQGRAPAGGPTP